MNDNWSRRRSRLHASKALEYVPVITKTSQWVSLSYQSLSAVLFSSLDAHQSRLKRVPILKNDWWNFWRWFNSRIVLVWCIWAKRVKCRIALTRAKSNYWALFAVTQCKYSSQHHIGAKMTSQKAVQRFRAQQCDQGKRASLASVREANVL